MANEDDMQKSFLIVKPFVKPSGQSYYDRMMGREDETPRFKNIHEECGGEFCSPRCLLAFCALYLEVVEFEQVVQ